MKKVAVLPYNEYEKMKYNNTTHSDQHTTNQSPLVQPQTVQPIQPHLQGLPSPAIHQQLQHQSPHIQNDSGPYLQPIPQSLHGPKVEQINNYEKEVLRILNSDINIH